MKGHPRSSFTSKTGKLPYNFYSVSGTVKFSLIIPFVSIITFYRRDRYDDPRYPPPPGSFEDRGRYGRGDREGFPDAGDRGPYGRPDRERDPADRRDLGDRREPVDMPFDRYGPSRGDPRYGDGQWCMVYPFSTHFLTFIS